MMNALKNTNRKTKSKKTQIFMKSMNAKVFKVYIQKPEVLKDTSKLNSFFKTFLLL